MYTWLVVFRRFRHPSEKMMEFVNWDDDIPNIWKIKHIPNHQSDVYVYIYINQKGTNPF